MDRIAKALAGFKVKDDAEPGSVQAVFSTFDVIDHDGDILDAAAFVEGQTVPMVWHHQWPEIVGKGLVRVQPDRAVFDGKFFLDTARGAEAYKTVKAMGPDMEWSYGFMPLEVEFEADEENDRQIRRIKRVQLFEVSPVLVAASMGTGTLALKSAPGSEGLAPRGKTERISDYEGRVLSALTAAADAAALTAKDGRVLSGANMARVHAARAALQELCESGACEEHSKSVGLDRLIRDVELDLTRSGL